MMMLCFFTVQRDWRNSCTLTAINNVVNTVNSALGRKTVCPVIKMTEHMLNMCVLIVTAQTLRDAEKTGLRDRKVYTPLRIPGISKVVGSETPGCIGVPFLFFRERRHSARRCSGSCQTGIVFRPPVCTLVMKFASFVFYVRHF